MLWHVIHPTKPSNVNQWQHKLIHRIIFNIRSIYCGSHVTKTRKKREYTSSKIPHILASIYSHTYAKLTRFDISQKRIKNELWMWSLYKCSSVHLYPPFCIYQNNQAVYQRFIAKKKSWHIYIISSYASAINEYICVMYSTLSIFICAIHVQRYHILSCDIYSINQIFVKWWDAFSISEFDEIFITQ